MHHHPVRESIYARPMNRRRPTLGALGIVVAILAAGCGEDEPQTASTVPPATSTATSPANSPPSTGGGIAATSVRAMTDEERALYREMDGPMECPPGHQPGGVNWDYGPYDGSEPTGRVPQDALFDAISEINQDYVDETGLATGFLADTGWVGLIDDDPGSVAFVYPAAGRSWEQVIEVGGDPDAGVWRHHSAGVCVPLP